MKAKFTITIKRFGVVDKVIKFRFFNPHKRAVNRFHKEKFKANFMKGNVELTLSRGNKVIETVSYWNRTDKYHG